MDVIREFLEGHSRVLTGMLQSAGFSVNQARDFLPEAVESILRSTRNTGIAHAITGLLDDPSQLMDSINTDEIAAKLRMRPQQVARGFNIIVPVLSQEFSKKNSVIVESAGRGSIGEFMGTAGKLFS